MAVYLFKFVLATLLFIGYRYVASRSRGWLKDASGMMLTFPAVNGIGFVAADTAPLEMAGAMLPMIALNGALAFFMISLLLSKVDDAAPRPIRQARARVLASTGAAIWLVFAFVLYWQQLYVPPSAFLWATAAYAVLGTFVWGCSTAPAADGLSRPVSPFWATEKKSIRTFMLLLLILLVATYAGANHTAIAQLSAMPLLPLLGLCAAAQQDDWLETLQLSKRTVLLGPVVAMTFAACIPNYLRLSGALEDTMHNMLVVAVGWLACLAIIAVISVLDHGLKGRSELPR